jgi:hypothetical protein
VGSVVGAVLDGAVVVLGSDVVVVECFTVADGPPEVPPPQAVSITPSAVTPTIDKTTRHFTRIINVAWATGINCERHPRRSARCRSRSGELPASRSTGVCHCLVRGTSRTKRALALRRRCAITRHPLASGSGSPPDRSRRTEWSCNHSCLRGLVVTWANRSNMGRRGLLELSVGPIE